jgi:hypothetical protein
MCRIASLFLLQRLKGSMSVDALDFNNIETRSVIKFFSPPARQGACGAPRPGRPKIVTTPEIMLEDRRISAKSIAEQMGTSR